jgi:hypothetical protein
MTSFLDKASKAIPVVLFGGSLLSVIISYSLLQYRVNAIEKRIDKASPELVVVELQAVKQRLNDIRDDLKELQRGKTKNE